MRVKKAEVLPIRSGDDVVVVRQTTRAWATTLGLSLVELTKLVTAASELARNTLEHGGGGEVELALLEGPRGGVRLVFRDEGPGIPDVATALRDGFTTGGGMGLGLGGARRLVNEFDITTEVGKGTQVTIVRWK